VATSTVGVIFDVKRFSLHDGPGIRTTIFLKGCPLNCGWCHNPEGITLAQEVMYWKARCNKCGICPEICAQHAILPAPDGSFLTDRERCLLCGDCVEACPYTAREIIGREATVDEVMTDIEKDIVFYDESGGGVTVSGGEPLSQSHFLARLLEACKEQEIHTTVDTTGFTTPAILDRVRHSIDLFLYDLKFIDLEAHQEHTGVSNELILNNLRWLSAEGHTIIIRVPIIPGINDSGENIVQTGEFVASLAHAHQVDILPFHNTAEDKYRRLDKAYCLAGLDPAAPEKMEKIATTLRGFGLHVTIGGQ
jgi:pyruvate formate lyase activating enzyme